MKKSVSLKLIIFSFLLAAGSVAYSAPEFQAGTGTDSTIAGVGNEAILFFCYFFLYNNKASGLYSSVFGFDN